MAAAISPASTAHQPFVRLDRASKKYGAFRLALSDVSLDIERSEFVLVLGASGAGKSTLLRLMSALEAPSSGSVRIGGEDPVRMRPNERAFLRRSIGVVLQEPLLLDRRSVLENVMLPAIASNQTQREAVARARAALNKARFEDVDALPGELSSGARRQVALARAIVNRPALLLVDDPVGHLDSESAGNVVQLLEQFAVSGVTVIMASQREPDRIPDRTRTVRLDHGVLSQ
jgi:cell division transport system ATP-binding protein